MSNFGRGNRKNVRGTSDAGLYLGHHNSGCDRIREDYREKPGRVDSSVLD